MGTGVSGTLSGRNPFFLGMMDSPLVARSINNAKLKSG